MENTNATEISDREKYIRNYPGSEYEIRGKIYDIRQELNELRPGKRKLLLLNKMLILTKEVNKLALPFTSEVDYENLLSEDVKYNEDGMTDSDEYNPQNWLGHDD